MTKEEKVNLTPTVPHTNTTANLDRFLLTLMLVVPTLLLPFFIFDYFFGVSPMMQCIYAAIVTVISPIVTHRTILRKKKKHEVK